MIFFEMVQIYNNFFHLSHNIFNFASAINRMSFFNFMRHFIFIFLLTIPAIIAIAQRAPRYTISGFMRDSLTTESLISATVYNKANLVGTSTNSFGFYSLTLPEGKVELVYSYVGYHAQTVSLNLRRDTVINVSLSGTLHLQEITVTAGRALRIQESTQMSAISVPITQIKSMPAFLGEVDVLKVLQLMPGIQSGGEGSSGLYVRGGGPDQNLILLDGVPVYNASHLFGFFSIFNADAVNSMEIIKGGFPARYGGRVSSVLDINLKEGNMQKFHGEGAVGIVSGKLTLEGPIIKDCTSFIVSGRRTFIDAVAPRLLSYTKSKMNYNSGYYFYDLTAKINHRFSANDRIYLSAYMGDDKFSSKDKWQEEDSLNWYVNKTNAGLKWGNITTAFRWNHVFNPKLFGNTTVTYSRYRYNTSSERDFIHTYIDTTIIANPPVIQTRRDYYGLWFDSGIQDLSVKVAFDYLPSPDHYVRFGAGVIHHTFNPGVTATRDTAQKREYGAPKVYAWEYSAYLEDDMKLTERLKANIGLHWSAFGVDSKYYQVWQPRISARYLITPQLSVKAAYSRMAQYIHLLTNSTIGLPTDLWVPTTELLRPQKSNQVAIGFAQNFREDYEISLEGYYKTMTNVMEYIEGANYFDTGNSCEKKILQGDGRSYGLELFAQKKTGYFTGWFGYTLSWTDRVFDELNNGKRFPYRYDRRHDLSIALIKRFGKEKKHELSCVWVYGTGNSVTLPIGIYYAKKPVIKLDDLCRYYDFGERNSYRMSAYHRLDLSVAFVKQKKWGERRWIMGVYNAYNRKNPFYVDMEVFHWNQKNDTFLYKFMQYSLFSIIPSLSYQFKF